MGRTDMVLSVSSAKTITYVKKRKNQSEISLQAYAYMFW